MADPQSFAGKTVVVTGAGRGLGLAMARRFGAAGAHVVVAEFEAERGRQAAADLRQAGAAASFEPLDVRDPAQSMALVQRVAARQGAIDVWVNNAGVQHIAPAEDLPTAAWDNLLAVLLSGTFYCSQAAGRHMLERGRGVIINVASGAAYVAAEGRAAYSTAKAGVVMLTQALGIEWARRGVRVVGVAPSAALTDLMQSVFDAGQASPEALMRRTPLGRLATVEEVAEAVAYLASDQASYVVAETLRVDGGFVAYQLF